MLSKVNKSGPRLWIFVAGLFANHCREVFWMISNSLLLDNVRTILHYLCQRQNHMPSTTQNTGNELPAPLNGLAVKKFRFYNLEMEYAPTRNFFCCWKINSNYWVNAALKRSSTRGKLQPLEQLRLPHQAFQREDGDVTASLPAALHVWHIAHCGWRLNLTFAFLY